MDLIRPTNAGKAQRSEYSIKEIEVGCEPITYTVRPDKKLRKRYRPCLIIKLESRRYVEGRRCYRHDASLVVSMDEVEKLQDALSRGLLNSFHVLTGNDLEDQKKKSKSASLTGNGLQPSQYGAGR
jgi:hypothetical protein